MIKNHIIDFDGTLMDTAPVILATMRATIEEMGLPERTEEECRATIGLRLEEIPAVLFPERDDIGEEYAATYRRLFPLYNKAGVARPFLNVVETIKRLHTEGHGLAIASSRSHRSLEEFVSEMQLSDAFQILIAGDDVTHGKPSPEPVQTILERMNWRAEETLVIGDAAVDIQMGKAAGCKTCAVTYGNGTREELESALPDFLINDFGQIIILMDNNQRIAPDMIRSLAENEIFVFGSNLEGMHGGGAAYIAWRDFGAVMGQGVGLQGRSYGIPTMQGGVETIRPYVDEFIAFAKENPQLRFLVTRIGCGIAGFLEEEIAPLFRDAMEVENIFLPDTFWEILKKSKRTDE